jgi:hypothetical protein
VGPFDEPIINPLYTLPVSFHSFPLILVNPAPGITTAKINEPGIALHINQDIIGLSVTPNHACIMQTFDGVVYLPRPAKPILICAVGPRRQILQSTFTLDIGGKQSDQACPSVVLFIAVKRIVLKDIIIIVDNQTTKATDACIGKKRRAFLGVCKYLPV